MVWASTVRIPQPVGVVALSSDVGCSKKGARCSIYGNEKVYLGVRVKMPVKDLLRNIRLAQGWEPQDFQETCSKTFKGDKKRVKTRTGRRTTKRKHPTKSLEELAIIVEVLEEDLKTGNTYCSLSQCPPSSEPPLSPELSPTGYNSDESDEMIPSPSPISSWLMHGGLQPSSTNMERDSERGEEWFDPQNHNWNLNSYAFFWTQLQKEENQLRDISDAVLLATDGQGRAGMCWKRALGYAIAKRMAALNSLDFKDSDGMYDCKDCPPACGESQPSPYGADLISLGANVNETNNLGKSCLHLSAEKGYIRGPGGMSVLQCASVALKATVCELESSKSPDHTRLHTLRKGQMMETLECLLYMGSYLHTMGSQSMQPRTA
ncbi:NF-kappa-B inhibitor zeta [Lates calcarifer]|uniref:NF-kappa-B inhibitor zeta n=1 Tax=Lates calcarifer TaxID=8187 RepID=A0AAJ8DRM7_LATCA|nr:NF-kappa-B inhibitor zeta [Lates calcarifer]